MIYTPNAVVEWFDVLSTGIQRMSIIGSGGVAAAIVSVSHSLKNTHFAIGVSLAG